MENQRSRDGRNTGGITAACAAQQLKCQELRESSLFGTFLMHGAICQWPLRAHGKGAAGPALFGVKNVGKHFVQKGTIVTLVVLAIAGFGRLLLPLQFLSSLEYFNLFPCILVGVFWKIPVGIAEHCMNYLEAPGVVVAWSSVEGFSCSTSMRNLMLFK